MIDLKRVLATFFVLLSPISAMAEPVQATAPSACLISHGGTIGTSPTRFLLDYINELSEMNIHLPHEARYEHDAVTEGLLKVLSAGEGQSNFISDILTYQKVMGIPLSAFALDGVSKGAFAQNKTEFPAHYLVGLFQEMDIIDRNTGKRVEFDEIVSFDALTLVLKNSDVAVGAAILERVISHLKVGGMLRLYPVTADLYDRIQIMLNKVDLETGYRFKVFAIPYDRDSKSKGFVLQRTK